MSGSASKGIRIHNVMTNIVGRVRTERVVSRKVWQEVILPVIQEELRKTRPLTHKSVIGLWGVEVLGNDAHMHEFFSRNWKTAPEKAHVDVHCYILTGLQDSGAMMSLLGLENENDVRAYHAGLLKALEDAKYRSSFRDPRVREIEKHSLEEQIQIALFAPATVYCPEEHAFLSINTNYYGQLKSKSSLGPLEELLIRKARLEPSGRISNPDEVWLSMHAGCVEYRAKDGRERGIVILAPTGTGKSTHCYGLVEAKKENKLHSDDWVFVNIGTGRVIISENHFYMRTNIAAIYPHLIPLLVAQPLENVGFTEDIVRLLESFASPADLALGITDGRVSCEAYHKIIEQMVENNSSRSLIDPRLMVGEEKFVGETFFTDLFFMKRDYDSPFVVRRITEEEMVEIMTSKGNVFNYAYGKNDPDGYGIPLKRTTEIYYNPYLCVCEVDREAGKTGELDRIRIECYRTLARRKGVGLVWVNTRLEASHAQFCIRRFIEEDLDLIRVEKGPGAETGAIQALGLKIELKPAIEGRRESERVGFYASDGEEVEVVSFWQKGVLRDAMAFYKNPETARKAGTFLNRVSRGTVEDFFKTYAALGARELLSPGGA